MIDVLYNFISPVTGRLPLTENYILIGGRQGFSVMSPKLIDIELELININHVLGDLSTTAFILGAPNPKLPLSQDLSSLNNGFMFNTAGTISTTNNLPLPSLPYNNIWVGNINNVAVPTPYVASQNNSSFILQTPNPNLPNSQALALLLGGILKSAAVTGVISIAIPDVDYATVATLEELAAEAAASAEEATGAAAEASASAAEATASAAEATGAAAEATGAAAEASFSAFEASLSAIEAGLSAIEASGAAAEATTSAAAAAISATEAAGSATAAALSATDAALSATAATTSAAEAATSATAASGYSAAAAASASGAAASAVDASSSASEAQDYLNTLLATGLNDLPCAGDVSFQGYTLINLGTPINPTDGANKEYVDNAISGLPYSTLTLQGAITGSGPLNLPVITTLNTTLNQITNAGNVNIANFLLNNVLDPISPQDGATKNYVDTATIAPSQISNYPSNSSLFLNGTGSWTAPSFSNFITTSSVGYEITINNTNASSTNTGFLIQNNGYNAVNFGFNNSTKEAYVWAYGSNALLKFGTNATTRMQLLSNGTLDLLTNTITGLATPINPTDGVNKQYVDTAVSGLPYSSLTLQGAITGSGPLNLPVITTLNTTLNQITNAGNVNIGNYNLNNVLDPINPQDGATKNYVDTSTIAPSRIISYPSNSSLFLNGAGSWTAPSFSNLITTSSVGYELTINNTNASSTNTGLLIQNNGFNVVNFGFNNSTNEAYVWAYGNALLKFGTNATTRMQLLNNGTLDLLTNTITGLANPVNPTDGVNKQYVDNATIAPSQISNYPSNSSLFLNGAGSWTAPSFSNLITTSSVGYELTINNTNPNSTDTGLLIQNNGYNAVNFGFNNSTKEAYVWAYGSNALLKFGTNATTRMQLLNNGTLTLLGNSLTGLATPVNPTDGVNKQYVDSIIASLTTRPLFTGNYDITNPAYSGLVEQVNIYIEQVEVDIAKIKEYINGLPKL
jgi:hypothetical protein